MDDEIRDRLRKLVEDGDREAFDAHLERIAENKPRARMPTKYERELRDERPKGEPDWRVWRCPACGTEQTGEECGYCAREAAKQERRR